MTAVVNMSRLIIEGVRDYAIFMLDPGGRIESWNEGARRLKQYEANEVIGKSFSIFYSPEDLAIHKPEHELEVAATEGRSEDEGWRIRKDGSRFWANVVLTAIRDRNGQLLGFSKITRDLSVRKKLEDDLRAAKEALEKRVLERTEALSESESQFRALADAMPHLAWIAHADGSIFWYNSRWFVYTGTQAKDMEDSGWRIVHDPAALPRVLEAWNESIRTGTAFEMEFPLRGADGKFRWFLTRVIPMRGHNGEVTRWVGTNTDIDDRKKISEWLKNTNLELEQRVKERTVELELANKEMESFSYSVSHDLRAPLRSISGFCNRLLTHQLDRLDEDGQDSLKRVVAAAQRMGRLIDDLLNLSQVSRTHLASQSIDMADLAESVHAELQALEPQREVSVHIQRPLKVATGDPGLIRVVLQNLFSNARKYSSKNPHPKIEFGQKQIQGRTVYYIRDNGVGFDMKYANKLFGAFQRLHSEDQFEGTGIGLATVKRIMRRHKGEVWAEAAPDCGATFYLSFPQEQKELEERDASIEHDLIS